MANPTQINQGGAQTPQPKEQTPAKAADTTSDGEAQKLRDNMDKQEKAEGQR
jgi:hypothetical protein